jgi:hypothetical protein
VEEQIRLGKERKQFEPLLSQLRTEMQRVQSALARVLPAVPEKNVSAPSADVDKDAVHDVIRRIAVLMKDYDGDAIELLTASEGLLTAALGTTSLQKIMRATSQFDFDACLAALIEGAEAAGYKME